MNTVRFSNDSLSRTHWRAGEVTHRGSEQESVEDGASAGQQEKAIVRAQAPEQSNDPQQKSDGCQANACIAQDGPGGDEESNDDNGDRHTKKPATRMHGEAREAGRLGLFQVIHSPDRSMGNADSESKMGEGLDLN